MIKPRTHPLEASWPLDRNDLMTLYILFNPIQTQHRRGDKNSRATLFSGAVLFWVLVRGQFFNEFYFIKNSPDTISSIRLPTRQRGSLGERRTVGCHPIIGTVDDGNLSEDYY